MIWKVVQACSIGTSHVENGEVCQDECLARTFCTSDGEEHLLSILSDGAGSAVEGGHGASVVCEAGSTIIEHWFQERAPVNAVTAEDVITWVINIRQRVYQTAEEEGLTPREFACTLLGALVSSRFAVFFQIGDGAIVVDGSDGLYPVFWPDSGEYANLTYFITDEDSLQHLHIEISPSPPADIAMFSDGLQRLALVYDSQTAYQPFFAPMLSRMKKADHAVCDLLSDQLAQFLDGENVNERTDDDKTLVLATRRSAGEA